MPMQFPLQNPPPQQTVPLQQERFEQRSPLPPQWMGPLLPLSGLAVGLTHFREGLPQVWPAGQSAELRHWPVAQAGLVDGET